MYLIILQNMTTHENRRRYDILKISRKLEFLPFSNKITHTVKVQNVNRNKVSNKYFFDQDLEIWYQDSGCKTHV